MYIYTLLSAFDEELNTKMLDIFQIIIIISKTVSSAGRPSPGRGKSLQVTHMDEQRHLKGVLLTCQQAKRNTYL